MTNFIAYSIRDDWKGYVKRKVTGSQFNQNTILEDGAGQVAGIMGELAFGRWLRNHNIEFDYLAEKKLGHDFIVNGLKIDIKSKNCTSTPRSHYTVHVTKTQKDYETDLYVFARVSPSQVWLCGYMDKSLFWTTDKASDLKQGQFADGIVQHADSRSLQLHFLQPMADLLPQLTGR